MRRAGDYFEHPGEKLSGQDDEASCPLPANSRAPGLSDVFAGLHPTPHYCTDTSECGAEEQQRGRLRDGIQAALAGELDARLRLMTVCEEQVHDVGAGDQDVLSRRLGQT